MKMSKSSKSINMSKANLDTVIHRLDSIDKKFEDRFNSIDKKFGDPKAKFKELKEKCSSKINTLKKKCSKLEMEVKTKAIAKAIDDLKKRISHLEQFQHAAKCPEIANEAFSKRLNLLIHGLDENEIWEKKETTLLIFKNFLQEGLNLNLQDTNVIDLHQLPHRPISKQGKR